MSEKKAHTNPFPGLRPFETNEYRLFFGREGQSDALIERLQRSRFLAVVGTSGSGKSSLVRAGLMPALRGGMMAGAGAGWRVAVMRPGHDPVGNLARVLAEEGVLAELGAGLPPAEAEAMIEATLRRGSLGLVDAARQARLAGHEKLLVVVDQFEELFRFRAARAATDTDDDASAFVKLLLEAKQADKPPEERLPIYVVLTMRSDFLGDCAQFQGLPEAINDGQYLIPRMTRDERRFAISGPVRVSRGRITEPLINRLLNEVGDNPDQLPILQHALMRTWDYWQQHRRDGEPIGIEHYEAVGTMSDALSLHAEEAWGELTDARRRIAELLFKALTERGADNREIRRPISLREICGIAGASEAEVIAVIEVFRREGRSFLMPPVGVELRPETVIDISHESLIRNWQRLKQWVTEEAISARTYRRLADAAVLHREGREGLLQDPGLQLAVEWLVETKPNATWGQRYHPEFSEALAYLTKSRVAREEALADKERQREEQLARERRELEQAQMFAAEQQRAAQRMRRMMLVLALVSLVALGAAGGAVYAYADARASRIRAEDEEQKAKDESEKARVAERSAVEQKRLVEEERNRAQDAERRAEGEQKKAEEEEKRAVTEGARAREQEGIARRNAEDARRSAEDARRQAGLAEEQKLLALDKTKQVEAAVKRGEMIRGGLEAFRREDFAKALDTFKQLQAALKDFQPGGPAGRNVPPEQLKQFVNDYGWTLTHIGDTQFKRRELSESVKAYEDALPILEGVIKPHEPAPILFENYHGLAHAYHSLALGSYDDKKEGYFAKAEEFFKRAAAYQEEHHSDEPLQAAAGFRNLARLYTDMKLLDAAEANYKLAVEAYRKTNDNEDFYGTLKELAEFYKERGRNVDAARVYNEIIDAREASTDGIRILLDPKLPESYSDLGQTYLSMKDEPGADADALKQRSDAAFLAADKIQEHFNRRDRGNELTASSDGGAIFINVGDVFDELGDAYVKLERFKLAERIYKDAASNMGMDEQKKVSRWKIYGKLADLYNEHFKDYKKAEEYYKLMGEARSEGPEYAEAQRQLAALYANKLDNPAEAEAAFSRAYSALAQRGAWEEIDEIFSALIELHRRQNNEFKLELSYKRRFEAMRRHRQTFKDIRFHRSPVLPKFLAAYAKALGEIADFHLSRKDDSRAEGVYQMLLADAPDIMGKAREAAHLGDFVSVLEKYRKLLLDSKRPDEAAKVEETIKAARARQDAMEQPRQ